MAAGWPFASEANTMKKDIEKTRVSMTGKAAQQTGRIPRRSNLIEEIVKARIEEHRSVRNLAEMSGVSPGAVRRLESGKGPVSTLLAVMEALPFHITKLAPGLDLAEQLRNRRAKKGMSLEAAAAKASLAPAVVAALERGQGKVQSLLSLLAVLAPTIGRRAPERSRWGPGRKADRDSRFTPASFMEPIYDVFGEIDLDPCGHVSSPVIARRRFLLSNGDDGLTDPWAGRVAFMNPPFSAQLDWLRRAYEQWDSGNVDTVVCLVPVRLDSDFFHDTIAVNADIYALRGRVPFIDLEGNSQVTPFSLMVVIFGASAEQRARFAARSRGRWLARRSVTVIRSCDVCVRQLAA